MRRTAALLAAITALMAGAACGSAGSSGVDERPTLRLGYFPNITHAPALIGTEDGLFARALGDAATLELRTFNAGPAAVEAILSGALDASYVGPNPAVNAYVRSKGAAVRVIAGAASGGAFLVVKPGIDGPDDLKGRVLATPQLGGTQDVSLRRWLSDNGLETDIKGGGDVSIRPQENSQTFDAFQSGALDGAWVPEPWATRLVDAGAKVLVDEATLWPGGRFVSALLVVRPGFLRDHPGVVRRLLRGHLDALALIRSDAGMAKATSNRALEKLTGKALSPSVLDASWRSLTFTPDPLAASLQKMAAGAADLGLVPEDDLANLYDLTILNALLRDDGEAEVRGL